MPLRLLSRKMFLAMLTGFVLLTSCKKDNDHNVPGNVPNRKIAKLYQDPQNYIEFTYNTDGSLSKIKLAEEETGNDVQTLEFFYGDNKRIANIFSEQGYRINYRYENDRLIATDTKDATGQTITSGSYFYENGNLTDFGYFMPFPLPNDPNGILYKRVRESKYTYNADRSIKVITTNIRNPFTDKLESAGRRAYEKYDNKINPLKSLPDFSYGFFQELNPSNVLKEVAYDADGSVEETVERSFTYDEYGYPLTCVEKTTEAGKAPVTKTLTFTYK